jgi:hypothetical protein
MNIYDTRVIRCSKCNRYVGEVEYDAEIILPKCGKCANPTPDGIDKLVYAVSKFNKPTIMAT